MKPHQIEDRIGMFLFVLATVALIALWTGGCAHAEKSKERVWRNGQWYDKVEK